jgi:hypothetical protein
MRAEGALPQGSWQKPRAEIAPLQFRPDGKLAGGRVALSAEMLAHLGRRQFQLVKKSAHEMHFTLLQLL